MPVDGSSEGGDVLATVPLLPSGHLHVAWGAGNNIMLVGLPNEHEDVLSGAGRANLCGKPTATTNVQWCAASSASNRIPCSVAGVREL